MISIPKARRIMVLIVSALTLCSVASADALIYSDQTAGSRPFCQAAQNVARALQEPVVLVTDDEAFVQQLTSQNWSSVTVSARFAANTPPYASELVAYASAGNRVEFYFWHDNGVSLEGAFLVTAPTAVVTWSRVGTTFTYTARYASGENAGEWHVAQTIPGYQFPDFENVVLYNPCIVQAEPEAGSLLADDPGLAVQNILIQIIDVLECIAECLADWADDLIDCQSDLANRTDQCDTLYGQGGANDPEGWTECMEEAETDYTNCRRAALNKYKRCIQICNLIQQAQPVERVATDPVTTDPVATDPVLR
ncbi:MAG: hypothetical protein KAY37_15760 [Phycisphaerae bacterium]|nr:hypothetical protein [Phycisphaerae bacterium]